MSNRVDNQSSATCKFINLAGNDEWGCKDKGSRLQRLCEGELGLGDVIEIGYRGMGMSWYFFTVKLLTGSCRLGGATICGLRINRYALMWDNGDKGYPGDAACLQRNTNIHRCAFALHTYLGAAGLSDAVYYYDSTIDNAIGAAFELVELFIGGDLANLLPHLSENGKTYCLHTLHQLWQSIRNITFPSQGRIKASNEVPFRYWTSQIDLDNHLKLFEIVDPTNTRPDTKLTRAGDGLPSIIAQMEGLLDLLHQYLHTKPRFEGDEYLLNQLDEVFKGLHRFKLLKDMAPSGSNVLWHEDLAPRNILVACLHKEIILRVIDWDHVRVAPDPIAEPVWKDMLDFDESTNGNSQTSRSRKLPSPSPETSPSLATGHLQSRAEGLPDATLVSDAPVSDLVEGEFPNAMDSSLMLGPKTDVKDETASGTQNSASHINAAGMLIKKRTIPCDERLEQERELLSRLVQMLDMDPRGINNYDWDLRVEDFLADWKKYEEQFDGD